jgi:hypothetical protein
VPSPQPSAPPQGPSSAKYQSAAAGDPAALKHGILQWAVLGNNLKPIDQLLGTLHQTFPPAFGVPHHDYFAKYKPFSADALMKREPSVMKRGEFPIHVVVCNSRHVCCLIVVDLQSKQTLFKYSCTKGQVLFAS